MSELSFYEMMSYQGDQIRELNDELQSLRAWKEKARPFLIAMEAQVLKSIEDGWIEGMEDDEHEEHERYLTLGCNHDTLTELLKEGNDENA